MDFLNYQYFVHMFKKAVRQAEIPVTPALPKVGHPLAGGGMSPTYSIGQILSESIQGRNISG